MILGAPHFGNLVQIFLQVPTPIRTRKTFPLLASAERDANSTVLAKRDRLVDIQRTGFTGSHLNQSRAGSLNTFRERDAAVLTDRTGADTQRLVSDRLLAVGERDQGGPRTLVDHQHLSNRVDAALSL